MFDEFDIKLLPTPAGAESNLEETRYDLVYSHPLVNYMGYIHKRVAVKNDELIPTANPEYSMANISRTYNVVKQLENSCNKLVIEVKKSARLVPVARERK